MTHGAYDPMTLAGRDFAEEFPALYKKYIALRVNGIPSDLAVIEAFELIQNGISMDNVYQLGMACDVNPYVQEGIKRALESSDVRQDLWPEYRAAHSLLKLIEDPRVRDTTRLNAIIHLNALCGYVVIDEAADKSAVQHSIADFQRQHAAWVEAGGSINTTH